MDYWKKQRWTYALAALPALAFLALQVWPLGQAVVSALTDKAGHLTTANITRVFGDRLFIRGIGYSLLVPVVSVALEAAVGLAMALWFYELRRGKTFWRTIAILPFAVPEIVYLLTMKLVFRQHGYLNSLLFAVGGEHAMVNWLSPDSPLMVGLIILIDAWRVTPIVFLIVLTGLEQIPESFIEAARIDGASRLQIALRILVPLVILALAVALALRAVDAFRIFATPLVLVGVDAMPVLTSVAYKYKVDQYDAPAANVAALTLALFLLLATLAAIALVRKKKEV